MDEKTKRLMLEIAREAIINVDNKPRLDVLRKSKRIDMKAGVFISVYIDGALRGCIGNIMPADVQSSIIDNALAAAYKDDRFPVVNSSEYDRMKISVNILSVPQEVMFESPDKVLDGLDTQKGLIIQKGQKSATFLPSVWNQLPDKTQFLEHLCMKAGLPPYEWKMPGTRFFEYGSDEFGE